MLSAIVSIKRWYSQLLLIASYKSDSSLVIVSMPVIRLNIYIYTYISDFMKWNGCRTKNSWTFYSEEKINFSFNRKMRKSKKISTRNSKFILQKLQLVSLLKIKTAVNDG